VPPALYDSLGGGYSAVRVPDPRIAAVIRAAIASARSVVNIGAGAGSYEPSDVPTIAVEPSRVMLEQRRASAAPAVQAAAGALPFGDATFDAALALLTIHHWPDAAAGIAEMRRVARRQVFLTWDRDVVAQQFWFARDYLPESTEREAGLVTLDELLAILGEPVDVIPVPVPKDCTDGFYAAYWARPHAYLSPSVQAGISAIALTDERHVSRAVAQLEDDLASGAWTSRYGDLLDLGAADMGYRLVATREAP
jgi:SAM-dependent methyltransferase